MSDQTPKLTKKEIASLDFLIEVAKENGGKMAWPGAAAAVVGAAGTMAVTAAVTAQIRAVNNNVTDINELLDSFRKESLQDEMTLEQLLQIRSKAQEK